MSAHPPGAAAPGAAGEGVLAVMRYKQERLDPVLVPLLRKTLVAQPDDPANFMHAVLGAMLAAGGPGGAGEAGPDYNTLRAENEMLQEQVRLLGQQLAEAQVAASRAMLQGGGGGGGGGGDDDYGDEEFDEDGDEESRPGSPTVAGMVGAKAMSAALAKRHEAACTLQRLHRGKAARARAQQKRKAKAELARQNAASHRIYQFWRAVRLRRMASKFGGLVGALKHMLAEERARREAAEKKALEVVEKRQHARMVRSQTKKQLKEADVKAREEAARVQAARAQAQAEALAARAAAAAEQAEKAKLKAEVHKSVASVVIALDLPVDTPTSVTDVFDRVNSALLLWAGAHTEHVRGFKKTPEEAWKKAHESISALRNELQQLKGAPEEIHADALKRTADMLEVLYSTHLGDDDDASDDTQTMLTKQEEANSLKRTKTEAAQLLALNPEGDLKKSDTEFYGDMFGGGGGADNSYDPAARRAQAIAKAKADAEKARKAKLLKARMESGIRIGEANSAAHSAERAARQAERAKQAYAFAQQQHVTVVETIKAETQKELEEAEAAMNWLVSVPDPISAELLERLLKKVECPSQDVVLTVGINGAWTSERGFIDDVRQFVLDYGSTQAAMEELDAADVLDGGFAHERFWDVVLGAVVAFLMEWHEPIFVIAVGTTPEQVAQEAANDDLPKVRITDEFVSIVAEAVEIAHEEAAANGDENPPDALCVLCGWTRAASGESQVVPMALDDDGGGSAHNTAGATADVPDVE